MDNCSDNHCRVSIKINNVEKFGRGVVDKTDALNWIDSAKNSWGRPQEVKDVCPTGFQHTDEFGSPIPIDDRTPISTEVVNLSYPIFDEDGNQTGTGNHDCDRYTFPADYTIELTNAQAEKDMNDGIATALAAQDCGRVVKALMVVRNASKTLTAGQKKQIIQDYSTIIGLLDSGSLTTAKEEIDNTTPDGVRITAGDIAALSAKIDECKPY